MAELKLADGVAEIEASRETKKHSDFVARLFSAEAAFELVSPFPGTRLTPQGQKAYEAVWQVLKDVDSNEIDKTGEIPESIIRRLKDARAFGLKIPVEYGGWGCTQSDYHRIGTLVGGTDANLVALLSAHQSIGVPGPVMKFGTSEQKKRFLPRCAAGDISCFGLTEPEVGTDVSQVKKHAVRVYENEKVVGYRLNGQTLYSTNALRNNHGFLADLMVVIARIVDDPAEMLMDKKQLKASGKRKVFGAFIVELKTTPGVFPIRRNHFMGLRALYIGEVGFKDAYVPAENRLDTVPGLEGGSTGYDGLAIAQRILEVGRLTLPAACLGGAKQVLNMLRCFAGAKPLVAKPRVIFGAPVGEHEANAEKIVRIAARTLSLEAVVKLTGTLVDEHHELRNLSILAKPTGSQWLWDILDDALQIRGGRGYETIDSLIARGDPPLPFERPIRDQRVARIFEGANEAMRLQLAREGASGYVDGGKALVEGGLADKAKTIGYFALQTAKSVNVLTGFGRTPGDKNIRRWASFIRRHARELTRVTVEAFVRYQQKLEKRQLVLLELSDQAANLFLMAVTLSYASHLEKKFNAPLAGELANWFCADVAKKVHPQQKLRQRVFDKNNAKVRSLAKRILDGEAHWLEEGIIPISDRLSAR